MIDVRQIRNFVSCNFTDAVLNGELKNGKIDLNLKLDKNVYENDYIHIYNVDLEEIRKNPELIFNYLVEKYLENNTIIGAHYFANVKDNDDKISFAISSTNGSFIITLSNDCLDLLPDDFVKKIEFAKRKGILKILEEIDVKKIKIHNFDKVNFPSLPRNYKTGLREDILEEGTFHYDALRIENEKGMPVVYEGEKEFVKKILEILTDKGNFYSEHLEKINNAFKMGYFNSMISYNLNDEVAFSANSNADLFVFMEFLNEYLNVHKDEIKNNQLRLVLNKKGE